MAAATLKACDGGTGAHCDDVVHLCDAIADELHVYAGDRADLLAAAQLHDIGKVSIPPEVLNKPGALHDREWALVRQHTLAGEQIIRSVPELGEVARLVRHSHERWDGGGYPDGLSGEQIPLASRIVFCADAFHAIRSDRAYRRGCTAQAALDEVNQGAGSQFDPEVVDALVKAAERLRLMVGARTRGLTATLRSRRLIALLLTLVVSGSALAAAGFYIHRAGSHASAPKSAPQSSSTADDTGAAQRAPKPTLPSAQRVRRARGTGTGHAGASSSGAIQRRSVQTTPRTPTRPLPSVRTAPAGTGALPRLPGSPSAARTPTRGRSAIAPRRPAQPGKPIGSPPGRSEEAPRRPSQPVGPSAAPDPAAKGR